MKKLIALLTALLLLFGISGCREWTEPAKVFYLNFIPEANEAWQKLASTYSDIYGVEVTVRTVSDKDYTTVIGNALKWEKAPTAFMFQDPDVQAQFNSNCLDLTGSALLGQMITGSLNLTDGGAVKAVCFSYDAMGIMVNTHLLTQAGYELSAITDYESLKTVAEDIHSRREELGFDAFTFFGGDQPIVTALADLAQFHMDRDADGLGMMRQMVDLYLDNSTQAVPLSDSDTDLNQFSQGQAVFCQHSTAIFDALVAEPYSMNRDDLAVIPIYCNTDPEQNATLSIAPRYYWAVNSQASAADRQATLDFLNWVVTSEDGVAMLQEHFGGVPFKSASSHNNHFYSTFNSLLADGSHGISPLNRIDSSRQTQIVTAVVDYIIDPIEENWSKVQKAFDENPA